LPFKELLMQWDFERDTAFITGAGSGIGQAISLKLAAQGVKVAVADLDRSRVESTATQIRNSGHAALPIVVDVSQSAQVERAVAEAEAKFGTLSYLVNVAGISHHAPVQNITDEEWSRMLAVHLNGSFYCIRALLPKMLEDGFGVIASLSSMHGLKGQEYAAHYSAAKAGIAAMTKAVAREVAGQGVRINALAPGPIDTPLWRRGLTGDALERRRTERAKLVPMGRLGTPEEVADLALFLLSSASTYLTGQIVGVNGGELMP
jgi:2-hydroxycyclohexanecarboxyl-CoA dehydrogenase